jgi:hypothetical protein
MSDALDAVYRATAYIVFGPEQRFTLRIDEPSPPLDDLLRQHGAKTWAFISACNPNSTPLPDAENRRRTAELRRLAIEAGYPFYEGEGVGDDGAWPPEPSLLILGITCTAAAELGRRFGQNAILAGETGSTVRLLWLFARKDD